MIPQEYYREHILLYTRQLNQIKKRRNLITFAKLFTFAGIVFQLYWLITTTTLFFLFPVGTIFLFIFLSLQDSRIVRQQKLAEELIRINLGENAYLEGKLTLFPNGISYLDPAHPYAGDLDLFGDDSLFQHLNRTVTANGTDLLVSWLLRLSKEPETIRHRQQAVAELSEQTEWCHRFRAAGSIYPTQTIDLSIVRQWQSEPSFFTSPRLARTILFAANGLTIAVWCIAATFGIPWSLPLIFSFIQLLALTLYLKKINRYHHKLGILIRTVSNYLPLVQLIHQKDFTSTDLQRIKSLLTAKGHSALMALSILNNIQEKLDQRGNILTAFILNGLYLKDLHVVLKLGQWKKNYGDYIQDWVKAISETDTLVSMANYRFNHPGYTVPQFSTTSLLDIQEAGHPLLKGQRNITNDFKIDTQHQLFIVTGANMAGKSTFLRTIGINLVLAQSGNVVHSSRFSFQPMTLFTSMRTTDNLAKNTSYFHAELLRLKQLIDTAGQEERLFIILDEMLKGTNSVDKLNGSLAFLQKLLSYPVCGLVATHDLALGELADAFPNHFFNVCFEITHTGNQITYDYKLHPGISNTMNASILLKEMGLID